MVVDVVASVVVDVVASVVVDVVASVVVGVVASVDDVSIEVDNGSESEPPPHMQHA